MMSKLFKSLPLREQAAITTLRCLSDAGLFCLLGMILEPGVGDPIAETSEGLSEALFDVTQAYRATHDSTARLINHAMVSA